MKSYTPTALYEAWLQAARFHLNQGTQPERFDWSSGEESQLFFGATQEVTGGNPFPISMSLAPQIRLPEAFETMARAVALHRSGHRWRAMYRVAWRLVHGESRLMERRTDPDIHELETLEGQVEAELKRIRTHVHWKTLRIAGHAHRIAWWEPQHHTLAAAAPAFVRQMGTAPWSMLTPERCIHWDGHVLFETGGLSPISSQPSDSELAKLWREHCAVNFVRAPMALAA